MQLTVREVSRLFKVPEKTVYRWIEQDDLPAYRIDEHYGFNRGELVEWATARHIPVPDEVFQAADATVATLPSLVEALEVGGIFHKLEGTDKGSVLRAVVEAMPLPQQVDRHLLLQMLLARESLQPTGVGEGIAIPHVRNPMVLRVPRPLITLCFLEPPVDFGALDNKPVYALFSLVSPSPRVHLHLLSRVAFALRDAGFKAAIARRDTREEIFNAARRVEANMQSRSLGTSGKER
jgi:PTS system nitrogen regulatory IIA component